MLGEGEGNVRVGEGKRTLVGVLFVESVADQGDAAVCSVSQESSRPGGRFQRRTQ